MRRIAGAIERMVRRNRTCSPVETCSGLVAFSTPKLMVGTLTAWLKVGKRIRTERKAARTRARLLKILL